MYYKNEYQSQRDRYKKPHILFNDIINVKNFDPNNIKIDKKSYKNILLTILDMWQ